MSYQVLARKWRPRNFQEMVGQEPTLRMLTNALDNQRLHHAYLFTGTRGVGKTTLARIFAKCLNCENGITSKPCGTCNTCQAIDAGKFLDLIEVDAASRTKVEDTRELLDNVHYAPSQGRYKIYLIDEVHMLSGHSFNALLKTLEEPPAHVKFLLATTDPKRLPITILSRCLQFNLSYVSAEKMTQHLGVICKTEHIQFEIPALELIAKAASGSLRDALSLLDQAIAYCGDVITVAETQCMLGTMEQDTLFHLLDALAKHDGNQLLNQITKIAERAPDFDQLLEDFLSTLHSISVAQLISGIKTTHEKIKEFAQSFSAEDIQLYYQIALIGRRDLPFAATPRQGFEMVMLRMLAFKPVTGTGDPLPRRGNDKVGEMSGNGTANAVSTIRKNDAGSEIRKTDRIDAVSENRGNNRADPVGKIHGNGELNWSDIISKLKLSGMALALASHCTLKTRSNDQVELNIAAKHEPLVNKTLHERIESALSRYFNTPIKLKISTIHADDMKQSPQQEQDQRHAGVIQAIKNDASVQSIIELFNATLDESSVKNIVR